MKSKKISIILFFLLLICNSFAQDRFFIITDTRLFEEPMESSTFYGYFKRGAEIKIIEQTNSIWTKVQSDNLTIGFVPKKYISNRLNAKDVQLKDIENPILEGGDSYYGGNHLFVIVAGLKGRTSPNKSSSIKRVLTNGEVVPINYFPIDPEEWTNIGYGFNNSLYVQRKYIGLRPNFEKLVKEFDSIQVSNLEERKKIAERLVELAINSKKETLKPAFERYLFVVKQLNDIKNIEETEFNLFILSKLSIEDNYNEVNEFAKNCEFIINGNKSKNFILPLNTIIKALGNPLKKEIIPDDCGIYLSDMFYTYETMLVSVDEKENKTELIEVKINAQNNFSFNSKALINNTTSERDFISNYGRYLYIDFKYPNVYRIYLESSSINFEFVNGKITKIIVFNYC